jgi:hypothetical protein
MIIAIAGVLLVPKVLQLTNRFLEEYVLPRKIIKSGTEVYPYNIAVALTTEQQDRLTKIGAMTILSQGVHMRARIEDALRAQQPSASG